jgi:predicted SnoaL-like aldol condensation-catalyzing enzyme
MTGEQRQVVEDLLGVMSGDLEISEFDRILAKDLILHLEGRSFGGATGMKAFLTFVRRRFPGLSIVSTRTVANGDGTITIHGHWTAERDGRRVRSDEVSARYRIERGAVVEVWTKRSNYEFFFGSLARSWVGFWLISAWTVVAYRLGSYRKTDQPREKPAPGGGGTARY